MPSTLAASIAAPRISRGIARTALVAASAIGLLAATHRAAHAQAAPEQKPGWELLLSSGTVVPTGAQRAAIKRANLSTAQVYYRAHPALAVTATLGWARSRDIASPGDPKLDVFTYDLGAEVRAPRRVLGHGVTFSPFAGVGAGARSYNYRRLDVDATHNAAAYGSVGSELGLGRVRLRLEARDYVSGFKPLDGRGPADTRNDVALIAGLHLVRR